MPVKMKKDRIRPIAIGLFIHDNRMLVFEGRDAITSRVFYRPLGGAIKFGETGAEALAREIREEIKQEINDITYQGFIENLFTLDGTPRHEFVLIYSARFTDETIHTQNEFKGMEDDGSVIRVSWQEISWFKDHPGVLVPPELLGIVEKVIR
jgi:8-oxo-dGTP pyrophosphatase MutT (NUDIX family)